MSVLVYGIKSEVIMAVKSDTADPGMEDLTAALNRWSHQSPSLGHQLKP